MVITWVAVLNRLPIKDRPINMGIGVDDACSFCQQENETRDHVFFGCTFAKSVWERVIRLCGLCGGIGS